MSNLVIRTRHGKWVPKPRHLLAWGGIAPNHGEEVSVVHRQDVSFLHPSWARHPARFGDCHVNARESVRRTQTSDDGLQMNLRQHKPERTKR
jgi:hypothetical protein